MKIWQVTTIVIAMTLVGFIVGSKFAKAVIMDKVEIKAIK